MGPMPWHWRAVYEDGGMVDEYDADAPEGRGFAVVERERCVALVLVPVVRGGAGGAAGVGHTFEIKPESGQRAIFTRRHTIRVNPADLTEVGRDVVHIIGYEYQAGGVVVGGHYLFCYRDGGTVLTSDFDYR